MKNIIQKLNSDKNITKLLKGFEKDFSRVYDNLSANEKGSILGVRDTIFRKWLYSPIIDETYVSPAYLINSFVIDSGEEKAMVLPHIKITVKDDGGLDFESRWIIYSKEEHPVIEDLKKLMNYCDPALILREGNPYIIDKGEVLIDEINFRSGYYLKFIIELALRVGMLEEMKAIGCKCYRHSKDFDKFEEKGNEEQLKLIIQTSIEVANKQFQYQLNHSNSKIVNEFLKAFVTKDDFQSYISELEVMHKLSFNEFLASLTKEEKDKLLGSIQNFNVENTPYIVATTEFGILMDMHFTSVFGYYLGLIIPAYTNRFSIDLFIKTFLWAPDEYMQVSTIFQLEGCHHLTQFAGEVLETCKKEELLDSFKTLNLEYIGREVDEYINSNNEF